MSKALNILLIEDDAIEIMKFNRVMKSLNMTHKIVEAHNGEEALNLLKEKDLVPDIIILDLNMPKLDGKEFLQILKSDEVLKYIPSIVLTTSGNLKDVKECYSIGIAGYILKPLKYDDYKNRISSLLHYWMDNEVISKQF